MVVRDATQKEDGEHQNEAQDQRDCCRLWCRRSYRVWFVEAFGNVLITKL